MAQSVIPLVILIHLISLLRIAVAAMLCKVCTNRSVSSCQYGGGGVSCCVRVGVVLVSSAACGSASPTPDGGILYRGLGYQN